VHKGAKIGFIMNLSNHDAKSGGTHWVAVWIDPVQDKSVEYYDSFSRAPPPSLMKDIKHIVDKINPDVFLKFKQNRVVQQSADSDNCGQFSMRFLMDRMRGKSFSESTGFDEKMKMHAVAKNEKEIEKLKKLPPFTYIE
jgi:LmbE family N-acetylglucosaminyl deacetylase